MAQVTVPIDADAATTQAGLGAGLGPHLPIGTWSGTRYRSAMRFMAPAGWAAWTSITSATLTFWISDHQHVGPAASDIIIKRMPTTAIWSKAAGTQNCNSGFSSGNATQFDDLVPASTDQVSFASGSSANAKKTVTVTAAVRTYQEAGTARIVFVFDQSTASDYTELWSMDKGGYDPFLTINYTTTAAPDAPVLVAPAAGATGQPVRPTFSWTHDATDGAQTGADVELVETSGPTVLTPVHVTGAAGTLVWPSDLTPGLTYSWKVRTSNATGTGVYSATRLFTVAAIPAVTVTPSRHMVFHAGAPRLVADWTVANGEQETFRVTAPGYDSGPQSGNAQTWPLDTLALTNGTPVTVTVAVTVVGDPTTYSDSEVFTPRWGLTTHRRDLLAVPNAWQSAVVVSTIPVGADLKVEYGSNTSAAAAPTAWFDDIADVPLAQWVYWRAWFIPAATVGPTLDKVTILSSTGAVASLDKWSTTRGGTTFAAPWSADTSEYVYGTRSAKCAVSGAGPFYLYSLPIVLRANRTYILTGLMKSSGDSGARIELQDEAGSVLVGPNGPIQTDMLTGTFLFYDPARLDVLRYKTPVYVVGGADITAYVVLRAGGVAGSRAWFDAIKLEESTVATAWSPGALGATIVDGGGVQIDGTKGGVFRYRGVTGGARDVVEGGNQGLTFGGDTELTSPSLGTLAINGTPIGSGGGGSTTLDGLTDVDTVGKADGEVLTYDSTTGQWLSEPLPSSGSVATHEAAADPHAGYRLESADHSHASSGLQAGQVAYSALTGQPAIPVAGTTPSTQAFADAAAGGAATTFSKNDHKHGMPADPVTAHAAAPDPHPGYLTPAEGAAAYEATGAVSAHAGLADPHTGYRLESADHTHASTGLQGGPVAYGSITGTPTIPDLPGHVAAADPHTGYRLESADHSHASTGLQAGQIAYSALTGTPAAERAAASTTPAAVGTAAVGVGTTDARADHVHATGAGTPSTQAFADAAATGAGPAAAMTDHKHAMPANPVVAHEAAGDPHSGYRLESQDHSHASTGLQAGQIAYSSLTGTPSIPGPERAAASTTPAAIGTAAVGVGTTDARSDHVHATGAGTPSTQAFGDAAATGSGPAAAMTDHKHAMPAAPVVPAAGSTPSTQAFGDAAAGGSATTYSKNDHKHGMPANPGGMANPMTADADVIVGGVSGAPTRLGVGAVGQVLGVASATTLGWQTTVPTSFDGTAPVNQAFGDVAAVGVATKAPRRDHVHGMPANPVTAHEAAADPHTGYVREADPNWTDLTDGGTTVLHSHTGGPSGAPTDVDYLVGTASLGLSNEIVAGTTPGGELGGTWAAPTVDAVHAGSAHVTTISQPPAIIRTLTASGTWTKPAGLAYIMVECVGGGGQGGGSSATAAGQASTGGGGGGGGYARKVLSAADLAGAASFAYAVAAGGSTAGGGATGQTGGTSTFSGTGITTVSAVGGVGGVGPGVSAGSGPFGAGGAGGGATGGDIMVAGGDGGNGGVSGGVPIVGGYGGSTLLGGSTRGAVSNNGAGPAGTAYGGGGAGSITSAASGAARAGGAGAGGVVIITEYYLPVLS